MHFIPRDAVYMILFVLFITAISLGCVGTPSYPPPNGSGGVWVEYHRTGGIAAFDDHLIIYENRTAEVTRRVIAIEGARFVLNETAATDLNNLFVRANFLQLKHFYPAPYQGADYFTYVIGYRGYEIQTEDTGIPSDLIPVIYALNRFLEQGCGGDVCRVP